MDRNYWLFGILAGVRAVSFTAIKEPQGIPKDVSSGIMKCWIDYQGDGHTPSYYTAKELLEIKNLKIVVTGFVNMDNYKQIKTTGVPATWELDLEDGSSFGWGINQEKVTIVSNEEMDRLTKLMAFWDGKHYYTECIWEYTASQISEQFFDEFVPAKDRWFKSINHKSFAFAKRWL